MGSPPTGEFCVPGGSLWGPGQSMDSWLSRLEGCRWLVHVKEALSTTCLAA
ncbi:Myotubularin-related protein 9-like [Vulpes lagopus]